MEYCFLKIWRFEKQIALSERKPPLALFQPRGRLCPTHYNLQFELIFTNLFIQWLKERLSFKVDTTLMTNFDHNIWQQREILIINLCHLAIMSTCARNRLAHGTQINLFMTMDPWINHRPERDLFKWQINRLKKQNIKSVYTAEHR